MSATVSNQEYLRRRQLTIPEMTGREWASWWDFPLEFHGYADVEVAGESVFIDFTRGSVPTACAAAATGPAD